MSQNKRGDTMSNYERAISKMVGNREKRLAGGYNCIPTTFQRTGSRFWPGIEKGKYYIVTASTGVGKSKLAKKLFVFDPVDFVVNTPSAGMDVKIFYFCLEESKVNFIQSMMSYQLHQQHNFRRSIPEMNSLDDIIEEDFIEAARQMGEYAAHFEQKVEVLDDVRHPYGIFRTVEDYLKANGTWEMTDREFTNNETGETYIKNVRDHYVPNHPDRYVIVVVDHLSLLTPEKGSSLRESMIKLSSGYFLELRDKYGCTVINVQQQAAETEKQQFTYRGQSIDKKLEPSIPGLGDAKVTARDADLVFGLFAPDRYEMSEHKGYNVNALQDHYRSLMCLKYRDGISNFRVGMFFDGAVGHFEELPLAKDMTDQAYNDYKRRVDTSDSAQSIINFQTD